MGVIRCEKGHFYDDVKFSECPHCARVGGEDHQADEKKTVAKFGSAGAGSKVTVPVSAPVDEIEMAGKTESIYFKNKNSNPISGWIVCVKGENKGRSYEIHIGKNYVGRSMKSDVVINDPKISRDNHFSVIYDPNSNRFFILAGASIIYLNDKMVESSASLKEDDLITAGDSDFLFIPFCKEGRNWND